MDKSLVGARTSERAGDWEGILWQKIVKMCSYCIRNS